ncbi:MAG: hypothetical protein M3Q65_03240, partial [Chloroflexota bacterium]|nr:hypothetical protein [Chloroflexota bacterium]
MSAMNGMSEEQREVLAAVARMEESPSGPVDEYTTARAAGILATDLSGQEYVHSPERERIRSIFADLEDRGLLRVERSGYWRPRTSLAGRRAVQRPVSASTAVTTRTRVVGFPPPTAVPGERGAVPDLQAPPPAFADVERQGRGWPAWWP